MSEKDRSAPDRDEGASVCQGRMATTATPPHGTGQLDLIDLLWAGPIPLKERFARFHASNPAVYELLVKITREFIRKSGRRRVGIGAVIEQARWWYAIRTTEQPKINNSYGSFYSRLIMEREEDLRGVFETRKSTADGDS